MIIILIENENSYSTHDIFSVLQVELSLTVSSVGFEALSTLRHLRRFHFAECLDVTWKHEKNCLLLCAQYLPQLKFIGRYHDFFCGGAQRSDHHNHLVMQQHLPKLSLALLIIGQEVNPHENFYVPELESLSLWMPMKDPVGLCDRFSTISALALYRPNSDVVMTVLQSVGGRLRSLSLYDVQQPMSFAKIFEFCPRLENIKIGVCSSIDTVWPEKCFSCVKKARMSGSDNFPQGFIMQVKMSAPKLPDAAQILSWSIAIKHLKTILT
jgi:hypothetical protein